MEELPILAIICLAYNHGPYIRKCLEGFVLQKTTFLFIAIVHDDASMDDTANIIREYECRYPKIIKPIYEKENQYSKKDASISYIIHNTIPKSIKYIAFCEGDDYWIYPYKLQMQVDFLEQHSDYNLSYTNYKILYSDIGEIIDAPKSKRPSGYLFEYLLQKNQIATNTVIVRYYDYLKAFYNIISYSQNWKMGDYPMWLELSLLGKFKYFSQITSVYRILKHSASHSSDINSVMVFNRSIKEIQMFYAEKNSLNNYLPIFESMYLCRMYQYCLENNKKENIAIFRNEIKKTECLPNLKCRLFKLSSKVRILEKLLSVFLRSSILRKIYSHCS